MRTQKPFVWRLHIEELTAECASPLVGYEKAQTQCKALPNRISELEVSASTHNGVLGVVVWAVPSLEQGVLQARLAQVWGELRLART